MYHTKSYIEEKSSISHEIELFFITYQFICTMSHNIIMLSLL